MSFKCQVWLSLNRVTLRVREVSSFVYLCSWHSEASRKIIPATRCLLTALTWPQALCDVTLCHQILNRKEQKRMLTRLFFSPTCRKIVWERDYIYPSLVLRPCVFVACSTKFTQKAWSILSRDVCCGLCHDHSTGINDVVAYRSNLVFLIAKKCA